MQWIQDILFTAEDWINHNVKFDALFFLADGVEFKCRLIDTVVLTHLYNSDYQTYSLKPLCASLLGINTGSLTKVTSYLDSIKSKSYADVPVDILGDYCCDDIRINRILYRYLQKERFAELADLWETEIKLTPVLYDMERRGIRIDETECKLESVRSLRKMIELSSKIGEEIGQEFTNSNDCIYDIFVNQFGLPILATIQEREEDGRWFDTGRPTFDKDAMLLYQAHPLVTGDPKILKVVTDICNYRIESTYKSLYLDTFLSLNVDGILHPNYTQCVRSGRLSCSRPNSQQQNERSKALIYPHKGFGFISNDYNQIEYRLIVHYINDADAIKAYNENPDTDFHQWVAELLQNIDRDPAKQLNFGMAYGAGKKRVTAGLMANEHIIKLVSEQLQIAIESGKLDPTLKTKKFKEMCASFAEDAYESYHERLPGIKETSRRATMMCKLRGFIFNAYGRRGYIPAKYSYKAFNRIIQSCAADIMKERIVALSPRYNSESRNWNLFISSNVHDENLDEVPLEVLYDEKLHKFIVDTLQTTTMKFRVPIITSLGLSSKNWAEASGKAVIKDADGQFIGGRLK
jgi:DNA polymerase-1